MSTPILATKLYIPSPPPNVVLRHRLIEQLNAGLHHKLTLISAPAGFGKTTLVSEWLASGERSVSWLSLDEGENDPTRFLTYLVAALQTIAAPIGAGMLVALQSPQPSTPEAILTALLNDIMRIPDNFVLVLDDYHLIATKSVDHALTFLIEHLPPQMHLVIATREDPHLPLARLRVRGQLTELRVADLRFTSAETTGFLNQAMGLNLSAKDIATLETRTEGWIVGLQLAAISLQGQKDSTSFITSFTGSHHFVMDYLVEEVLQQQPESIQRFLVRTSILNRLCGPLCDAVLRDPTASGQATLEWIEHANLFIIPLDNERRWYRYHHLFAELLQQRLQQSTALLPGDVGRDVAELHRRASVWYEEHGLEVEAFQHAVAAQDVARAERLIAGDGMPLQFRGATTPILNWLASQPTVILDARPSLWVTYASVLSMLGQNTAAEQKLRAAEAAMQSAEPDEKTRNLIGHIAAIRALLAATQYQVETIITQSRRALEYLHPNNLAVRTATIWKLGYAYQLQGDRVAASQAYTEAIAICRASGNAIINLLATIGLGNIQEAENHLHLAAQSYRSALKLAGDPPMPTACEALLGLARLCYEWNDMEAAQQYAQQSAQLAQQLENMDRIVSCEVLLARLKLTQGDVAGASALLAKAGQIMRQHNFVFRMPEVAAAQVLTFLHQGNVAAAAHLAQTHKLPISQARVCLAQGDTATTLAVLEPWHQQVTAKGWKDEQLKVMVLLSVAHYTHGEKDKAVQLLGEALALAAPSGFIRLFVDAGDVIAQLLSETTLRGMMPDYASALLTIFASEQQQNKGTSYRPRVSPLIEPLSQRELEVLRLIAKGHSNHEISERLFLALSTVKGYNRKIFDKLTVQRRTEAVARARELGML